MTRNGTICDCKLGCQKSAGSPWKVAIVGVHVHYVVSESTIALFIFVTVLSV